MMKNIFGVMIKRQLHCIGELFQSSYIRGQTFPPPRTAQACPGLSKGSSFRAKRQFLSSQSVGITENAKNLSSQPLGIAENAKKLSSQLLEIAENAEFLSSQPVEIDEIPDFLSSQPVEIAEKYKISMINLKN